MEDDYTGDPNGSPVLVASTGKNDTSSGSAWGSGLLNFFTGATGTAGNVVTSLNQTNAQKAAAKATAKNAAATSNLTKIVLLGVGGVVVVVLLVVLLKRK